MSLPATLKKSHFHTRAHWQRLAHQPPHLDHSVEVLLAQVSYFLLKEFIWNLERSDIKRDFSVVFLADVLLRLVADKLFDNLTRCLQGVLKIPEQIV